MWPRIAGAVLEARWHSDLDLHLRENKDTQDKRDKC